MKYRIIEEVRGGGTIWYIVEKRVLFFLWAYLDSVLSLERAEQVIK